MYLPYWIYSGSSSPKRLRYASNMAWPFSIPALALAMREVMAPMGFPGARRGMKKLNDAATKTTRKNMPMRRRKWPRSSPRKSPHHLVRSLNQTLPPPGYGFRVGEPAAGAPQGSPDPYQ